MIKQITEHTYREYKPATIWQVIRSAWNVLTKKEPTIRFIPSGGYICNEDLGVITLPPGSIVRCNYDR